MKMLLGLMQDRSLKARAMRSSVWAAAGYGASQAVRLASNLILTRLLFPEAFGLMALANVVMIGLAMFSDVGLGPAIMQNRRGDDPEFLNTAWTIQVARGVILWIGSCVLAWPLAAFYGEPMLAEILPVAGLALLIGGFNPTAIETANRHLALGRVMQLDLAAQIAGIVVMIVLASATGSIWSLVFGIIITALVKLAGAWLVLPGAHNRIGWQPEAARDLIRFGSWIIPATACGFLLAQGDKTVLGKYVPLDVLGIYNIGFFLAIFPVHLSGAVAGRVLIPVYREKPPSETRENFRKLQVMRIMLTGPALSLLLAMGLGGPQLIELLYDPRYSAAGAVVTLVAIAQIPVVIGMSYDKAALAAGASRQFFLVVAARAAAMMVCLIVGAEVAGMIGALVGQVIATVLAYPLVIRLARRHGAWDPLHDACFAVPAIAFSLVALWINRDSIADLLALVP